MSQFFQLKIRIRLSNMMINSIGSDLKNGTPINNLVRKKVSYTVPFSPSRTILGLIRTFNNCGIPGSGSQYSVTTSAPTYIKLKRADISFTERFEVRLCQRIP